jgi:hypothetical protein
METMADAPRTPRNQGTTPLRKRLAGSPGSVVYDEQGEARCLRFGCGRRWNGLAQCDCNLYRQPSTKRSRREWGAEEEPPFEPQATAVEALRARAQRISGGEEGMHPVVGLLTGEVGVRSPARPEALSPYRASASGVSPTLPFERKDSPWRRGEDRSSISPTLPFERKDSPWRRGEDRSSISPTLPFERKDTPARRKSPSQR